MKIALAQMRVVAGSPRKNLETMLAMVSAAKNRKADLIAFPEMCLSGYLIGDKYLNDSFCRYLMEFNDILLKASHGIALAYGNVYLDENINRRVNDNEYHPNKDGRIRRYNAVYVMQNGVFCKRAKEIDILPVSVQKTLLPNYRIFDDVRYFFSLKDIADDFNMPLESLMQPFIITVNGREIPVGFELCEDLWCEDYRLNANALNPSKMLIKNGAEFIINLSASPWTFGKNHARDKRIMFLKQESGDEFVPFLYVNCVGAQNTGKNIVTFDGSSTVYNKDGQPIMISSVPYKEDLMIIDSRQFNSKPAARIEKPEIAQKLDAIIEGIRHMKDIMGMSEQPKYIHGLSGGVDSAVVASILKLAVGSENVTAVNMPTKYNSAKTKSMARSVAAKLGIKYTRANIMDIFELRQHIARKVCRNIGHKTISGLDMENMQARIRGNLLWDLSAKNIIFTSNGNKLEIALGYNTLNGDTSGALCPIGDLSKSEVFALARYLNAHIFKETIIPEALIPDSLYRFSSEMFMPSAELEYGQFDPMKWGYHCALLMAMTDYKKKSIEDVMGWYTDGTLEKNLGISTELIQRWDIDKPKEFIDDIERFCMLLQKNVFKRIQAPPIIILGKSAFGNDIRESMLPYDKTFEFDRLKQQILKMDGYKPKNGA